MLHVDGAALLAAPVIALGEEAQDGLALREVLLEDIVHAVRLAPGEVVHKHRRRAFCVVIPRAEEPQQRPVTVKVGAVTAPRGR